MLSISSVKGAKAAKAYFSPEQYYQKGEVLASQTAWFGHGAAALELSGAVEMQRFKELLDGKIGEIQLGRVRDGQCEHHPGWDLTFSAPKSLSMLALIGGDERLIKAHQAAVDAALRVVEQELTKTRQRISREAVVEVATGNLLAAQFLHSLSRENDPQLHTHCVIANATQREDVNELPDLVGYLRLGRGLPLARFESQFVAYPVVAASFVERSCRPQPRLSLSGSNVQEPPDKMEDGRREDNSKCDIRALI